MELIFELIFELIIEIVGEMLVEGVIVLGVELFQSKKNRERDSRSPNLLVSYIALSIIGGLGGCIAAWLGHHEYIPQFAVSFWAVLIGPIGSGAALYSLGRWRRSKGKVPSLLATFWGGTLFAFSFSLVRWLILNR